MNMFSQRHAPPRPASEGEHPFCFALSWIDSPDLHFGLRQAHGLAIARGNFLKDFFGLIWQ
jgi:hypothetical protein